MHSHKITPNKISNAAVKVMDRLLEGGYQSYLVGGGVRDLLLGGHPKDFDVATNATPEEIRQLFRNSRIIGRRFRIVHVRFGREIIEVTTFRGNHDDDSHSPQRSARSDEGMLLRDNVYGDIESDAERRDLTINALYYSHQDGSILDFTGGVQDIDRRKIRIIGDPQRRYQEDPVRMLRVLRFAAKLDFSIANTSARPIEPLGRLLNNIPPARLFEESLKLFMHGHALAVFTLLRDYNLLRFLFPATQKALDDGLEFTEGLITEALTSTDNRIRNDRGATPAFIFAALLWTSLCRAQAQLEAEGLTKYQAHLTACQNILSDQCKITAIPKRLTLAMKEIWDLQHRLERRQGKQAEKNFTHPRFRAAYDFLLMREQSGENLQGLGAWWTRYQEVGHKERLQMQEQLSSRKGKTRRRSPRRSDDSETAHTDSSGS